MVPKLYKIMLVIFFFPATLSAEAKMQLELVHPVKPFAMKVGDPLEIKFNAVTSPGEFFYGIFLEHAGKGPWKNGSGPLSLKPLPLKQGLNTFKWDGISFGWAPTDDSVMGKLKKGTPEKYYFNVMIFDSADVSFLGRLGNSHKKQIAKLRSKNFDLN